MKKKSQRKPLHPLDEIKQLVHKQHRLERELADWLRETPAGGTAPFLVAQISECKKRLQELAPPDKP